MVLLMVLYALLNPSLFLSVKLEREALVSTYLIFWLELEPLAILDLEPDKSHQGEGGGLIGSWSEFSRKESPSISLFLFSF
jgi:hypothetical protein